MSLGEAKESASPSPRSSRGRDERSSLLEGWGEGLFPQAGPAESPPHPKPSAEFIIGRRFASTRWTSPRKRGEVRKHRRFDLKPSCSSSSAAGRGRRPC